MTDAQLNDLARAARVGGRREVDLLLTTLRPVVARWAVVLTGSPDEAEDIAQAVLLRVHRSLSTYTPQGNFNAWAYRITRNAVADSGRKRQRDRARVDLLTRDRIAAWLPERSNTLELLAATEQLRRFMIDLSPQQRAVLDLIELQGFSHSEVAEMLEVSPATVRVHLHRAKTAMSAARAEEEQRSHG